MSKLLVFLNPHAGNGGARSFWGSIEPYIQARLGETIVHTTANPQDIAPILHNAYHHQGIRTVIAVGGDGTNHSAINAIVRLNEQNPHDRITYGNLPVGTGRDWARGIGLPTEPADASAQWLVNAAAAPTDIGKVTFHDRNESDYFLNIASTGLGGEVVRRVNRRPIRRSWTFLAETVGSILTFRPPVLRVRLDGQTWYEGSAYLAALANGTTFGRGMKIAPNARIDDGQFDVILVKGVSRLTLLTAFQRVYNGSHLTHPAVMYARAARVNITVMSDDAKPLSLELDGELYEGRSMTFELCANLLTFLRQPQP
jgi:YegS/Rv2252/BmrU family lipid kinase